MLKVQNIIDLYYIMEFPNQLNELELFLTHILRIPQEESSKYAKELAHIGYDDIQCNMKHNNYLKAMNIFFAYKL